MSKKVGEGLVLLYLLLVMSLLVLIYYYFKRPHTILLGLLAFLTLSLVMLIGYFTYLETSSWFKKILASLLMLGAGIGVFSGPLLVLLNSLMVFKPEGRRLFSLGCLLLTLFIASFLWANPSLRHLQSVHWAFKLCYWFLAVGFIYALILLSIYNLASLLNLGRSKSQNFDYIIVLGAGLQHDQVSPTLARRLDKAIELFHLNPKSCLIMSGGQGEDELISEAQAMTNYVKDRGVDPEQILQEDRSTTTYENLLFCKQLIDFPARIALVTNYYHLLRALLIADELDIPLIGIAASADWLFSLNAYIREYVGFLYLKKKEHILAFIAICLVVFAWLEG
ncbi:MULTISPECIES: YdcF family protein [Facklamia]|uniref:YdcF family protein n=1 Tax=Facklamia TaxID=66831 RepID=UPI0003A2AB28|nr:MULTISPECIES: YdcF family protein [Facklamia]